MNLKTCRYITLRPRQYLTLSLCSGFIYHMISTEKTYNFNKNLFPSGILAWKYDKGTSTVATYFSLYVSMINVVKSALIDTVGDAILYPSLKYCLSLLPLSHFIPFMVPSLFFFIRFTASVAISLFQLDIKYHLIYAMTLFPSMAP